MTEDSDELGTLNTGGGAFFGGNISGRDITARDEVHGDKFTISGSGNIVGPGNVVAGSSIRGAVRTQANEYFVAEFRERLLNNFNSEELEFLAFDYGANWDDLAGVSRSDKARSLIAYALRRDMLADLIRVASRQRPNVDWNVLPNSELYQITQAANAQSADHLKIFLSYMHRDAGPVTSLYQRLKSDMFDVWLDLDNLVPGEDWDTSITAALSASDVIVFVLSPQSMSSTPLSRTLDLALKQFTSTRQGSVFIIAVLLAPTDLPEALRGFQAINYYEENGYRSLVRALRARAANLGVLPVLSHQER